MQKSPVQLRGMVIIDQMQPQFAATIAANSDGYFPIPGETACWVEVCPGIAVNRLLDAAGKAGADQPEARAAFEALVMLTGHLRDRKIDPVALMAEVTP